MQDVFSRVSLLRRPRILARAARLGARNYCRKRDLRRILGYGDVPKPAAAVMRLLELEEALNAERKAGVGRLFDDPPRGCTDRTGR